MKRLSLILVALASVAPLHAQSLSLRPFALVAAQRPAATTTFDAAFQSTLQPFWGGGLQIATGDRFYVDVLVSRWKHTGERAFIDEGGHVFRLGIPLTATITPVELAVGYRFRRNTQIIPYVAGGIGWYAYREQSDFSDPGEDQQVNHAGPLVNGGVEFRVSTWLAIAADAQYTHISGILGQAGISQAAGEHDLGGIAARARFVIGR